MWTKLDIQVFIGTTAGNISAWGFHPTGNQCSGTDMVQQKCVLFIFTFIKNVFYRGKSKGKHLTDLTCLNIGKERLVATETQR